MIWIVIWKRWGNKMEIVSDDKINLDWSFWKLVIGSNDMEIALLVGNHLAYNFKIKRPESHLGLRKMSGGWHILK